jgi:hypothetical protein
MARRTVRLGRLVRAGTSSGLSSVQWSSAVLRENQRLGRGLRVEGRVRPARLVRARTSLAMSREQAARRSGKRPATRRETHGPKYSEAGASTARGTGFENLSLLFHGYLHFFGNASKPCNKLEICQERPPPKACP